VIIFISQSFISLAETIILNSIQSENVKSKQEIAIENSVNEDEKYLNISLDENIIDTLSFLCKKNFDSIIFNSFKDHKADCIDKNLFEQFNTSVVFISRDGNIYGYYNNDDA
jgi:hypothetical protein